MKDDTNGVLKILINEGQKHKYISLRETIPFLDFNPNTQRVRKTNPHHAYYNGKIETELSKILIADKKETFDKKQKVMFSVIADIYIKHLTTIGSIKTYTMIKNHFIRFLAYNGKTEEDIDMALIDNNTIEDFSIYLVNVIKVSGYTRNKYMVNLKTIINYGIKKRLISYTFHPFLDLDLKKEEPNKKNIYLNENEIYRLKKLKYGSYVDEFWLNYNGNSDKPKKLNPKDYTEISDVLYNTQLMGLLQISAQGIRVSDLFLLRPSLFENNYFRFKQKKTGIFVNVYLNEYLIEVLTKIIEYKLLTNYYDELESDDYDLIFEKIIAIKENIKEIRHSKFNGKDTNAKLIEVLQKNNLSDFVEIIETLKIQYANDFFCLSGLNHTDFSNYFDTGKTDKKENGLLSSKTASYNEDLKRIQKHAKISKVLTTHIFRHTFANTALTHNTDLYAISKALGHSSITKTETYLRDFDTDKVEALINNTISKIVDLGNYLNFELKE
jgi:integrase